MLASLKSLDQNLFWLINAHHTPFFDHFFSIVTFLGTGWGIAPILLFFILKGIPASKRVHFILFSLIVMIASGLINSQVKHSVRTLRPIAFFAQQQKAGPDSVATGVHTTPLRTVHVVGDKLFFNSFPSGHSNTAFSAATLLLLRFGAHFWPAFLVAGLVGYGRVSMGAHFPSDVIAGGLLGIIVVWTGFIVFKWFEEKKTTRKII